MDVPVLGICKTWRTFCFRGRGGILQLPIQTEVHEKRRDKLYST